MNIARILIDGTLLSLIMGVLIFGSLWYNPRLWLQDYPKAIQAKVPPLTPQEKQEQKLLMIPFLLAMIGIPFWSAYQLGGEAPFLTVYLTAFLVTNIFNLFDAVVIDWLVLIVLKPKFALIPGTEDMAHLLHDPEMHLSNYLRGIVFCAGFSLVIALVVMVVR
jgi:hypothetical protein